MRDGRRLRLRRLLDDLSRDWREAAYAIGVEVYQIESLPIGAAFAFDTDADIIWATVGDNGCAWAAWAGIAAILATRAGLPFLLSDLCAVASEIQQYSGLFLVSNSA